MKHLGFDIGATHLRITALTPTGIGPVARINTPADPREAIDAFVELTATFAPETMSATGGVAAIVAEDGSIVSSTNLPQWDGFPFARLLGERLKVPVSVRNDAELAGLGEATYGAGKELSNVAYIGLGTGVGTSHVISGEIEVNSSNGDARNTIITLADGSTLEECIGGHSLSKRYGVAPKTLSRDEWLKLTPLLAEGVAHAITLWSPEVVILGGSLMSEEAGFRVPDIIAELKKQKIVKRLPQITKAALGDSCGLYGARAWAQII